LTAEILNHWNGEVLRGESTIEQPSDRIQIELRRHKVELENKKKTPKDTPESSFGDTITQFVQVLLAERISSTARSSPSIQSPRQERQPSPPIVYSVNPEDDTRAFFDWWDSKEGVKDFPIPVRRIEEKLLEHKWRINDMRDPIALTP
jgi:hypothetical protein